MLRLQPFTYINIHFSCKGHFEKPIRRKYAFPGSQQSCPPVHGGPAPLVGVPEPQAIANPDDVASLNTARTSLLAPHVSKPRVGLGGLSVVCVLGLHCWDGICLYCSALPSSRGGAVTCRFLPFLLLRQLHCQRTSGVKACCFHSGLLWNQVEHQGSMKRSLAMESLRLGGWLLELRATGP